MKKIFITFLLIPAILYAQSFLISNIPLPKIYIQNLDPYPCDEYCLQEYIDNDMIFSFLAHAQGKLDNKAQNDFRIMNLSILNLGSMINSNKIKIALLLPFKKIGKYASSTMNASFAYLMTKNQAFDLQSYNIEEENADEIRNALEKIKEDGFAHIIAPLTRQGALAIIELNPDAEIFFPTINKNDIDTNATNLYFGGIDYKAQSDMLLKDAKGPLVIFYDESQIGEELATYEALKFKQNAIEDFNATNYQLLEQNPELNIVDLLDENATKTIEFAISKKTTNLQKYIENNPDINQSTCFVNTPIVKTGMILSQLTLYDTNATKVLSTQVNYDPLLLSMTQYIDRKSMVIANSITEHNKILSETNSILNNDIEYDWINYTTTVGMDYFFHKITNEDREYHIEMIENQMHYPVELLQPSVARFIRYIPELSD